MAAVLSACPNRRSKSQERLKYFEVAPNPKIASEDNYVLEMLAQLPPTRELLKHYQEKLESYEKEEEQLLARVQACAQLLDTSSRLERELSKREADIEGLKDDLEAVSIKLHSERRSNLKLGAENDKFRIKDVESQRKINVLLKLCGKSDQDIVKMLDQGAGDESKSEKSDRIKKLQQKASLKSRRSSDSLELEIVHLEQQLLEQEKLHREQLKEERGLKNRTEKTHLTDKSELREKIAEFQSSVAGLENQIQILTSHLSKQKSAFRKGENNWLNERTVMTRKIQFFEKFGTLEGTHSEHRFKSRISGEKKLVQKIQKLEKEVETKDREVQIHRQELLKMKNEVDTERIRAEAAASILAKKTKSMTEQVNILNDRCEKLDQRKSLEVQGYQSDIKLLKGKLSQLETKLMAVTDAYSKEQENKALLEQLRQELKLAEQRKPRQWRD